MTDTHPDVAPYATDKAECAHEGCNRRAHTHIVVVHDGVDHRVPFCVDHHLEYSQPGHLKILKRLAGISHLFHHEEEPDPNPAFADQHVEPPYVPEQPKDGDMTPMEAHDAGAAPEPPEAPAPGPAEEPITEHEYQSTEDTVVAGAEPPAGDQPPAAEPAAEPAPEAPAAPAEGAPEEPPAEEPIEPSSSAVEGAGVEPGPEVIDAPDASKDA